MLDPDDMLELMSVIEAQGGESVAGRCQPSKFTLKIEGNDGVTRSKDFLTSGCGNESRFLIPYRKPDRELAGNATELGAEGTAVACAHDDMIYLWPRFIPED